MKYFNILKTSIKLAFLQEMAYQWNFFAKLLALASFSVVAPIVSFVIYGVSNGLPGWNLYQLLVLQGTSSFTMGVAGFLFGDFVGATLWEIREGYFDRALVRPASPLVTLSASWPGVNNLASIFVGLAILSYGLANSNAHITISGAFAFALLFMLGVLFIYSLSVITVAIGFIAIKSESLYRFVERLYKFADYPISIFGSMGIAFFTFVFPIGLASFYPAQALLGVLELKSVAALVVVSLAFFGVSLLAWNAGMKKYQSAGG